MTNEKEKLKALKRIVVGLPESVAVRLVKTYREGEKTGYATIDRPWDEFYSSIKENEDFVNTTPYQGLVRANKNYPDEIAIRYFGSKITYSELFKGIEDAAKALEEYGVKKGDVVTICSTATPEMIYIFYALSKIGAIANVMSPYYTSEAFVKRVNEFDSKFLIVSDAMYGKFKNDLNNEVNKKILVLPYLSNSFLRFFKTHYKANPRTNEVSWKNFLKDGEKREEVKEDTYEEGKPQAIIYSGEAGGNSKAILLSIDSFQKLVNAYNNSGIDTSRGRTFYQNVPPWYLEGLSLGINFPLSNGMTLINNSRLQEESIVKDVLKYKPEYLLTTNPVYEAFTRDENLRLLKGKSLAFLKYPFGVGEPLTPREISSVESVFYDSNSTAKLLNGYGQVECGGLITTDIANYKFSNRASGIPLPGIITLGVFDDDMNELKYNERGNILVKTELAMNEYFNKLNRTRNFFYEDVNGEKWNITGDCGYINNDGSLVVLGRNNDYSVIDGIKVFNFDIENAILDSGLVKECEIQVHPQKKTSLVAHIIWEDDVKEYLKEFPEQKNKLIRKIQDVVGDRLEIPEAVPYLFCIKDHFPINPSGRRNTESIKNDVSGLFRVNTLRNEVKTKSYKQR